MPFAVAAGFALGLARALAISAILFSTLSSRAAGPDVQILLNGAPAAVGNYPFPFAAGTGLVLDNGLIRFNFNRDDPAGGVVTGWDGSTAALPATTSITAVSIVVAGRELAHNLNGVDPRDPDRQHSFYIDEGGGRTRLVCSEVRVLRNTPDLVEVAFVDTTSTPLRHEHHLIMRRGRQGIYAYNILRAVVATSINEVRMNARWDRSIFDHAFNWERGTGQQPTYGYLATQTSVGDETWQVDAANNAGLPAGSVYTKYNWSLYHHENPMFGHYGHGFGAWLTPLGGVTDQTLAAFYGVGPNHQDLAIHQDALILNYFGANHYGLPSYALPAGYARLYGPWYVFVNTADPANPAALIADAAAIATQEIAENRGGSDWISDPLYPSPAQRTTVSGKLQIADGRPADGMWALLSTQDVTEVYTIHEPTYFAKTDASGRFSLPGIPPGTYNLYIFAGKGSITDQFKRSAIAIAGAAQDLGTITWTPPKYTTFLWQIGKADRMGGEFALATNPVDLSNPRSYEKPALVPANLNFTIGSSWEPQDWYYAQTNAGVWTVTFTLDRVYTGTAHITISSSMQQGGTPLMAVNGSTSGFSGALPLGNDSTIARQADRSGRPLMTDISFAASRLIVGTNTVTFTKDPAGSGFGWDTVLLEVNESTAPPPAQLSGTVTLKNQTTSTRVWTVTVTNSGAGPANLARVDGFVITQTSGTPGALPRIIGRDPNRFSVPLGAIPPGGSARLDVQLDLAGTPADAQYTLTVPVSANGGSATSSLTSSLAGFPAITVQPVPQTVAAGGTVVFNIEVVGTPATYQWFKNGVPLSGATSALLILRGLTTSAAGNYTCTVANAAGSTTSTPAALSVVATSDPGKLSALSIRGQVGTGGDVMIAGLIVEGSPVKTLIQAVGPTISTFAPDLANSVLQNPNLELYQLTNGAFTKVQVNDDWGSPASGAAAISAATAASGATSLTNAGSKDSALLSTLSPGVYTANVAGIGGTTGIALLQAYAVPSPGDTGTLTALSIRGRVGARGDAMIAGFVVAGSTSKTVLIQAVGPTLTTAAPDLAGSVLTDPRLELYQMVSGSFVRIRVNDDWGGDSQLAAVASATGATILPNAASKDSALVVTLPPGTYTANVSGLNNTGGVVLLQAYAVP